MSRPPTERAKNYQTWLNDAGMLRMAWVWWLVLITNMVIFAWGLREVDRFSIVPISCVWLGAFSCCMIFHVESVKRVLALRAEVEELRKSLEDRAGSGT